MPNKYYQNAIMSKTSIHRHYSSDTYDSRLVVAQNFCVGDRVRHQVTRQLGVFQAINLGFALPEVWIQFDTDLEIRVPISCNPLELELVRASSGHGSSVQVEAESGQSMSAGVPPAPAQLSKTDESNQQLSVVSDAAVLVQAETLSSSMSELATGEGTKNTPVEMLEELSQEEEVERHRLELKVERAFYEAGVALRELRDKKLYRSTHKTFEEYCRDRFGYSRQNANYFIAGASVVDNLKNLTTICCQILPTKEIQVRPLTKLEPDEQQQVWQKAIDLAGGKVPSGRIVKGIVERLKQKPMLLAKDFCQVGDVFILKGLMEEERKYNNCWAIACDVSGINLKIDVHDAKLTVKPENLKPIDSPDVRRQLPQILKRIRRLRESGLLDRCAYTVLESLGRQTYLTDLEEKLLSFLEQEYGIK